MPGDVAGDDWNEPPSIAGPIFVAGLASALLGALLALGVLAWLNGGLQYAEADADLGALRSRIADLDSQVEDLEERALAAAALTESDQPSSNDGSGSQEGSAGGTGSQEGSGGASDSGQESGAASDGSTSGGSDAATESPTEETAAEEEEEPTEEMATHEPSRTPKPTATRRPTSTPRSR